MNTPKLLGRILLRGDMKLLSGLHIGGAAGALAVGNLDLPVIRDALSGKPYIPGSSLKGKMRSLSEKLTGAPPNKRIGRDVYIHVPGGDKGDEAAVKRDYEAYWVNPIFGTPAEIAYSVPYPSRLIVRDVPLSDASASELERAKTDLPYTEVKWEAAIDRVTSAATPRQIERVPAGAVFSPMEIVFNAYLPGDVDLFLNVLRALELVEDDYLGGQGSRGSGKVEFNTLAVSCKVGPAYEAETYPDIAAAARVGALKHEDKLKDWLGGRIKA